MLAARLFLQRPTLGLRNSMTISCCRRIRPDLTIIRNVSRDGTIPMPIVYPGHRSNCWTLWPRRFDAVADNFRNGDTFMYLLRDLHHRVTVECVNQCEFRFCLGGGENGMRWSTFAKTELRASLLVDDVIGCRRCASAVHQGGDAGGGKPGGSRALIINDRADDITTLIRATAEKG